jgi:triphosphatase
MPGTRPRTSPSSPRTGAGKKSGRANTGEVVGVGAAAEVEAKLLVPHTGDLRIIGRMRSVGPYRLRRRGTVQLHSTYFDTSDFALARRRVALRVRRADGHWEATAKTAGQVVGDIHERPEWTVALPGPPASPFALPPGSLQTRLAALVAGRSLRPVLITEIRRQLMDVLPAGTNGEAPPLAELALDQVTLRDPAGAAATTTYDEVEIECRAGKREDLEVVVRGLRERASLLPSPESKLSRGLAALYPAHRLRLLTPQSVRPGDTVATAVRKLARLHLEQLRVHDPGTRLDTDPEELHDMRVATRRLRALVRAIPEAFPIAVRFGFTDELRWLAQTLGAVRDLDVQLGNLRQFAQTAPPAHRPALDPYRTHLERKRAANRTEMLAALDSERYYRLLRRLERFAEARTGPASSASAHDPVSLVGRRRVRKAFQRLLQQGGAIQATPAPEDLHALRIRAKRFRYLLEFLRDLTAKPGRRLVKRLIRLQDLLGTHHDAVVAAEFVRGYADEHAAQLTPSHLLALGGLVGNDLRAADHACVAFQRTWQRFSGKKTHAEFDRVLRTLKRAAHASNAAGGAP